MSDSAWQPTPPVAAITMTSAFAHASGIGMQRLSPPRSNLGCQTDYSEDVNDSQKYDGVQVVNPVASGAPAPSLRIASMPEYLADGTTPES